MNYLETYWSRVNHLGNTISERIRNGGIRSFEKWLAESPHTVRNLSVERGIYFDGIILKSKDKEYEKITFLEVANDIPIKVGDIMNWLQDDKTLEKWIIIQEEKKVNGTFRSFWIVRCNYLMKWIDAGGHLQQSWAYFVSSLDSKIKGNYRTWNNLITPQPNKYAELLMPYYDIARSTNFIVEDESWNVIEYDHTSVPGIIYLSLTENKINLIYDDTEKNIADLDKRAKYTVITPETVPHFAVGDEITNLTFTIMKNGIPYVPSLITYTAVNSSLIKQQNNNLIAVAEGETEILLHFPENIDIEAEKLTVPVIIDNLETSLDYYIDGPDMIRLDRNGIYLLKDNQGHILQGDTYELSNLKYASIWFDKDENNYVVHANNQNLLGELDFSITINGKTLIKTIKIVPLW